MAITNGYVTLSEAKSALRITDTDDDAAIEIAVESASRMIDGECRRQFFADGSATARVFVPVSRGYCVVDDISTTTGLVVKTDTSGDGTFATTWTASDYQLRPLNARQVGQAWCYESLEAVGDYPFLTASDGQALVQVTADWGWPAVPLPVKQACLVQAVALFKGPDTPFGVAGFGDAGELQMRSSLHPQAMRLIQPFRRDQISVA